MKNQGLNAIDDSKIKIRNAKDLDNALGSQMELLCIHEDLETHEFFLKDRENLLEKIKDGVELNLESQDELAFLEGYFKHWKLIPSQYKYLKNLKNYESVTITDSKILRKHCLLLIKIYNRYLGTEDEVLNKILVGFRIKLESIATFDKDGYGKLNSKSISFFEYIDLKFLRLITDLVMHIDIGIIRRQMFGSKK